MALRRTLMIQMVQSAAMKTQGQQASFYPQPAFCFNIDVATFSDSEIVQDSEPSSGSDANKGVLICKSSCGHSHNIIAPENVPIDEGVDADADADGEVDPNDINVDIQMTV
jgi:hypothetical protein